jgi:curved DNA-binding protein CbpA
LKTHYDLLSVERSASAQEIKTAFRREIARYHPDKVQHLGSEFQEIAASRAAALTEAYRILTDPDLRSRYDDSVAQGGDVPTPPPAPAERPAAADRPPAAAEPAPTADTRFAKERASTSEFLRRAVLSRIGEALASVNAERVPAPGFDVAFAIKGRKALFKKADPDIKLLVRIVDSVDPAAVQDTWAPAVRAGTADAILCVLLLGSGLAPARDLAAAVSEQRRKGRKGSIMLVPVDMRDWEALLPPETPGAVRSLLGRLRQGE